MQYRYPRLTQLRFSILSFLMLYLDTLWCNCNGVGRNPGNLFLIVLSAGKTRNCAILGHAIHINIILIRFDIFVLWGCFQFPLLFFPISPLSCISFCAACTASSPVHIYFQYCEHYLDLVSCWQCMNLTTSVLTVFGITIFWARSFDCLVLSACYQSILDLILFFLYNFSLVFVFISHFCF